MRMRLLVLGLCCASFAARAADAPATGKITGRVIIAGLAPKLPTLPVTKDNKICGVNKPDEALVIGTGGGIRNAVLWLSDVPAPKGGAAEKYRLEAQTCRYEPHVVIARAGATLEVVDGDPVLHHPHAEVGEEKQWSFPMPIKGYAVPRPLPKAEVVRIGCEAHPWMRAWVVVPEAFHDDADAHSALPLGESTPGACALFHIRNHDPRAGRDPREAAPKS